MRQETSSPAAGKGWEEEKHKRTHFCPGGWGGGRVWDYNYDLLVSTLLSQLPGGGHLPPRCLGLSAGASDQEPPPLCLVQLRCHSLWQRGRMWAAGIPLGPPEVIIALDFVIKCSC